MSYARRHLGSIFAVLSSLLAAACGGAYGQIDLGPLQLEVSYHGSTDGRPLEALMLHSEVDNYDELDNLLVTPLEKDDATRLTDIETGIWYITVIRKERPLPDSPRVALTTADPVVLHSGRYKILVFDDFFRVMNPVQSDDATP